MEGQVEKYCVESQRIASEELYRALGEAEEGSGRGEASEGSWGCRGRSNKELAQSS